MDELIQLFNRNAVRYLLIGGQADRPEDQLDIEFLEKKKEFGLL